MFLILILIFFNAARMCKKVYIKTKTKKLNLNLKLQARVCKKYKTKSKLKILNSKAARMCKKC